MSTTTTTEAQRQRYQRRVWADRELAAVMTPETLHAPLPLHGPLLFGERHVDWRVRRLRWPSPLGTLPHPSERQA